MKRLIFTLMLCTLVGTLSSCSTRDLPTTVQPTSEANLTPYYTATLTPTITPTPQGLPTATPAPTVTPTPRVYEVKVNDTLITIACAFGVTLEELQAVNPDVNPALLSIGTKLIIPAAKEPIGTQAASSTTPFAVTLGEAMCVPSATGGYHCYALVENNKKNDAENLTAEFRLTDPVNGEVVSQVVPLSLNRLTPGSRIPFYTYFAPPVFENARAGVKLLTATKATTESASIFPLVIATLEQVVNEDGHSARVSGSARLQGDDLTANRVTLLAVAFDAEGEVIGMRRLGQGVELNGMALHAFSFTVYSNGGRIVKVEVLGEAVK
jgi:LysM repeat protein